LFENKFEKRYYGNLFTCLLMSPLNRILEIICQVRGGVGWGVVWWDGLGEWGGERDIKKEKRRNFKNRLILSS
jgi:hypothetical protein